MDIIQYLTAVMFQDAFLAESFHKDENVEWIDEVGTKFEAIPNRVAIENHSRQPSLQYATHFRV